MKCAIFLAACLAVALAPRIAPMAQTAKPGAGEDPVVAIGLSPMIPLPLTWFGQVWRAIRLQLREFAGTEGRRGAAWAVAMLANYVGMVLTAPAKLFAALSCAQREFVE